MRAWSTKYKSHELLTYLPAFLYTYILTYFTIYLLTYLLIYLVTYFLTTFHTLSTFIIIRVQDPRSESVIVELYSLTECRIQRPHTSDCCAAYRSAGGGGRLMEERILRHQRRRHRITYVLWITSLTKRSLSDPRPHSERI